MTEPITVTIKYGKGFEEPWLVLKANNAEEAKRMVGEATGLPIEGLTLAQVTYNASLHVQRMQEVGTVLGGTVIQEESTAAQPPAETPAADPEADAKADVLSKIESTTEKGELTKLYLQEKGLFDRNQNLMDALKAKATSL